MSVVAADGVPKGRRFIVALRGLTAVNLAINVLTLATGPLQARLLGPQGRGELALVMVVTGLAPAIVTLGLGSFLAREISQTRERGVLLGTVIVLSTALGLIGALCAYPVSGLFAHGGEVQTLILVGLLTLPVTVVGLNLSGAYWGEERWRLYSAMRVLVPLLIVCSYIVLAVIGAFTVVSAAATIFVAGFVAMLPLWTLLRSTRGWGFSRDLARRGLAFGAKASIAGIANQGNVRADQLFVASLVSARELGFYVVAATLATATLLVSQALNLIVVPMVATGDHQAVRRILRITLAFMTLAAIALAVAAAPLVRLLFGATFGPSVGPAQILCFASIFIAGKGIVSAALVGHGRPGETAVVESATFAILVAAMLLVVPEYGANGAAAVVVMTSAAGFGVLALRTRTWFGGSLVDYLVPTAADIGWLRSAVRKRGLAR